MNVRRGLFRLWIVLALLWAVFIGSLTWEKIYSPVVAPRIYVYEPETRTFAELVQVDDVPNPRTEISFAAEKVTLVLSGNPSHAQARAIVDVFRPGYVDIRHSEAGLRQAPEYRRCVAAPLDSQSAGARRRSLVRVGIRRLSAKAEQSVGR